MIVTRAPLRVVEAGETKPSKEAMTVLAASSDGSVRDRQVALQARLARAIDDSSTPAAALAALSRQYQDVTEKLESLDAREAEELRDAEASPDEDWAEEAI